MASRQALYYSYGTEGQCSEIKEFIQNAGITLIVRDIEKQPFTVYELTRLIGHLDIKHFLNPSSKSYIKYGLDRAMPERREIFRMMTEDHTLIKRPIICSKRLITVGCDKARISEMLQINANGEAMELPEPKSFNMKPSSPSRSSGRPNPRHAATRK